jgi:hypothetical protein
LQQLLAAPHAKAALAFAAGNAMNPDIQQVGNSAEKRRNGRLHLAPSN